MDKLVSVNLATDKQVAETIFDIVNNSFIFENKKVRTIIVNNEIWFCGKDIAGILGYLRERDAIKDNVDNDDKKSLKLLINLISG